MSAVLQLLPTRRSPHFAAARTPYLDLDVRAAVTRYRRIGACLPGTAVHYAVKANPEPALLAALVAVGGHFDVASPAEVVAVLEAGAAAGDLVYSNPVKRRQDIAFAARLGVRMFVVDPIEETQKVAAVAPGSVVLCRILTSEDGPEPWLLDLGGALPARLEGGSRTRACPADTPDETGTPPALQRRGCAGLPGGPGNLAAAQAGSPAAAPTSSSWRSMVVRSGTSRMNSTATRAMTAQGAAIRNTCPVAVPKACSKTARTGAGRVAMSGMVLDEPPAVGWTPSLASPEVTPSTTWWLSTAPSAETPIEPPIERKNATSELAAPMSRWAVLFCTARTRFCMVAPSPRPSTAMKMPTRTRLVVSSMVESSDRPTITSTMPPTRNFFQRPVLELIRPVPMLETSRPPTIAMDIRPACVGDMPCAIWKYCER